MISVQRICRRGWLICKLWTVIMVSWDSSTNGRLTWNARRKKFMFHSGPETQYLLVTVILIEARQYAIIETAGLWVIWETGMATLFTEIEILRDLGSVGRPRDLDSGIRTTKSWLLDSSMPIVGTSFSSDLVNLAPRAKGQLSQR